MNANDTSTYCWFDVTPEQMTADELPRAKALYVDLTGCEWVPTNRVVTAIAAAVAALAIRLGVACG